jgi:UDP-2,3-diacylglucosamine hydrolase
MTPNEDNRPVNANMRIAILAGTGRLPQLLANTLLENGSLPFVVNLTAEPPTWIEGFVHANVSVTHLSKLIRTLRSANISSIILAGGIKARPHFVDFLLDWRMYSELPRLYSALKRGDDGLLRAAIGLMERLGFTVLGAHEVAPNLLATDAILTLARPSTSSIEDASLAISVAIEHGRQDLGQAIVVRSGHVIAKEDKNGTAAMLMNIEKKTLQRPSGVLVKWAKPNQELRVDLPSIGPDTIIQARDAGLAGIVVEAGHALILDREEVVRLADVNGLFVMGMRSKL